MRVGSVVGSVLIVLCCVRCAGPLVLSKNDLAFGEPTGFYPGRGEDGHLEAKYSAWLAKNQAGIADVQNRIVEIKSGARLPGCIGEDKYTCVATLSQRLTIADNWASQFSVFPEIKYDVNGKPINGSTVMLDAYRPSAKALHDGGVTQLILDVSPSGSISRITAMLPEARDPLLAHTQEDYDRTHVYEVVAAVTAKTCPTLTSPEVARWIENVIKPTVIYTKETSLEAGMTSGRAQAFFSRKTVFCGRTFSFNSSAGYYREGFSRVPYEGTILSIE